MKVLIQSFSFKKTGYPKDKTGKGGGFVFDCRAIDAFDYTDYIPGTAYPHMYLTGLDPEVVDALANDAEANQFFEAAFILVRLNIGKCIRRNFPVMTVNFGCTAGQHRSVYLAELMARSIQSEFPDLEVDLVHLEKDNWPVKT